MVAVELVEWRPPLLDEDRCKQSEGNDPVRVVPSNEYTLPEVEKVSTCPSTKAYKPKASEAHESKSQQQGYVGSCNSFGSFDTYSTLMSSNPSADCGTGNKKLKDLSSFEDSMAFGRRSSGSFEDSVPPDPAFEQYAPSKTMSSYREFKLKSLQRNKKADVDVFESSDDVKTTTDDVKTPADDVKTSTVIVTSPSNIGKIPRPLAVHERLAKTETVASAGIKRTEQKKKVIQVIRQPSPKYSFNRHTQGKFVAPELRSMKKKTPASHDNVSISHDPAFGKMRTQAQYASYDAALKMKMDKLVRSQMKHNAEERVFFSKKSAKKMDPYQQKRPSSQSRVRHASKNNYQLHPRRKSAPRIRMQSNSTDEFDKMRPSNSSSNQYNQARRSSRVRDQSPRGADLFYAEQENDQNSQNQLSKTRPPLPMIGSSPNNAPEDKVEDKVRFQGKKVLRKDLVHMTIHGRDNKTQKKLPDNSIFDRLATKGTAASLWKSANYPRYANGHDTFNESVSRALLRNIKGCTYMPTGHKR